MTKYTHQSEDESKELGQRSMLLLIRKSTDKQERYPAGSPGGTGGRFAPKGLPAGVKAGTVKAKAVLGNRNAEKLRLKKLRLVKAGASKTQIDAVAEQLATAKVIAKQLKVDAQKAEPGTLITPGGKIKQAKKQPKMYGSALDNPRVAPYHKALQKSLQNVNTSRNAVMQIRQSLLSQQNQSGSQFVNNTKQLLEQPSIDYANATRRNQDVIKKANNAGLIIDKKNFQGGLDVMNPKNANAKPEPISKVKAIKDTKEAEHEFENARFNFAVASFIEGTVAQELLSQTNITPLQKNDYMTAYQNKIASRTNQSNAYSNLEKFNGMLSKPNTGFINGETAIHNGSKGTVVASTVDKNGTTVVAWLKDGGKAKDVTLVNGMHLK